MKQLKLKCPNKKCHKIYLFAYKDISLEETWRKCPWCGERIIIPAWYNIKY